MELLHTQRFKVASYELGPNAEARPSALMNYLQEAAGAHAATWGLGVADLLPKGRTWVISRYHLELERSVGLGEELEVRTWPSSRGAMFATRDFELFGRDGRPVARATTSWAMIDLQQKKPMALDAVVPAEFQLDRRALGSTLPSLPRLEATEREVQLPVLLRDLDLNVHVNHPVYLQWALETVPLEVLRSHRLRVVEIAYRAEARYGDVVLARRGPAEGMEGGTAYLHQILHAQTGAELTRLRTRWAPRA